LSRHSSPWVSLLFVAFADLDATNAIPAVPARRIDAAPTIDHITLAVMGVQSIGAVSPKEAIKAKPPAEVISALAAIKDITATMSVELIIVWPASQHIATPVAVDAVITESSREAVMAGTTTGVIVLSAPVDAVVSAPRIDSISPPATKDDVWPVIAKDPVATTPAIQPIGSGATVDEIKATESTDHIVSAEATDALRLCGPNQNIVPFSADDVAFDGGEVCGHGRGDAEHKHEHERGGSQCLHASPCGGDGPMVRRLSGLDNTAQECGWRTLGPVYPSSATVPTCSTTMPPDMPVQSTSVRPASRMISAMRSGPG
jgi:hypothetical protein